MTRPQTDVGTRLRTLVLACILLGPATALGQGEPGPDDARGHVAMFEILDRTEAAQDDASGASLAVVVEVPSNQAPRIVLVGPGGRIDTLRGTETVFGDLPQGDYLVAATAPGLRMAYGTLSLGNAEAVGVALRLFHLRRYYADEAGTRILGIFKMDVADNVAEGIGTLEVRSRPAARVAVVGADGVVLVREVREAHAVRGLEVGPYLVAVTHEDHAPTIANVMLSEDESTTLDVQLDPLQP